MKVNITFGRFGAYFFCSRCGCPLNEKGPTIVHPTHRGTFRKREIKCMYAGKEFLDPFMGLELLPAPAEGKEQTK
jgi:hypothetical protein